MRFLKAKELKRDAANADSRHLVDTGTRRRSGLATTLYTELVTHLKGIALTLKPQIDENVSK